MDRGKVRLAVFVMFSFTLLIAKQSQSQMLDAQAASFATRALNAMTNGVSITNATLTGTATRTAGGHAESGSAALKVRFGTGTRLDLSLAKGRRTEIHNTLSDFPKSSWSGPNGASHRAPIHNSWVDAGWCFPPVSLASMLSDPHMVLTHMGTEDRGGIIVEHLRASRNLSGESEAVTALVRRLSTIHIYLDAKSALPVAVAFKGHPDNDATVDFPIEIRFSDYQTVNGARVPMTIEKLVNGGSFLKLSFNDINVNSGLADTDFQIQ